MELRIAVLYNTDFEHIAGAASPDAVSVRAAATSVRDALRDAGHRAELIGMWGKDVPERDHRRVLAQEHRLRGGVARVDLPPPCLLLGDRVGVIDASEPAPVDHPARSSPNSWSST